MVIPVMGYLAAASHSLPAIVGTVRYVKLDKVMKLFTVYCVVVFLDMAAEYALGLFRIRNYFLSNIFHLIEVPFVGLIYLQSILSGPSRKILVGCILLYVSFWLIDAMFFTNLGRLNNILAMTSRFFVVVMSSITLQAFLKSAASSMIGAPIFWILSGMLLYCSGSFVVLGLSNQLLEMGKTYFDIAWHVNWVLSILSMIVFTKGLVCKAQA